MPSLPDQFKEYLPDVASSIALVTCKQCGEMPDHAIEFDMVGTGRFISLQCNALGCKSRGTWFVCCTCKQRFPRRKKAEQHGASSKHKDRVDRHSNIRLEGRENGDCIADSGVPESESIGDSGVPAINYALHSSNDEAISASTADDCTPRNTEDTGKNNAEDAGNSDENAAVPSGVDALNSDAVGISSTHSKVTSSGAVGASGAVSSLMVMI